MPVDIRIRFGRAIHGIRAEQGINQEEATDDPGCIECTTAELKVESETYPFTITRDFPGPQVPLPKLFERNLSESLDRTWSSKKISPPTKWSCGKLNLLRLRLVQGESGSA